MEEVDKIIKDYVNTHNKNFDIYFLFCEFKIQFDNKSTRDLKTDCVHNIEIEKINQCLLYSIEYLESKGYKFQNFNQMTINIISDRCNITYEIYIKNPMPMVERRINSIIAKNPQLINSLDRNKNHPLF